MPRQLPWLNKGGSKGHKQLQKVASKHQIPSDFDDDFFADTVLATEYRQSDDEVSERPTANNNARNHKSKKSKGKEPVGHLRSRLPSSSPPPAADLPPPEIEFMDKGVDKFDLRDDEFMMVEDELLQTAKIFTRHLHLAEYGRMKSQIADKRRNETVGTPRHVVAGAKPSIEGKLKRRAQKQAKAQQDFFEAQEADEAEKTDTRSTTISMNKNGIVIGYASTKTYSDQREAADRSPSDSDDLDAPKRPASVPKHTAPAKALPKARQPASGPVHATPRPLSRSRPSPPQPIPRPSQIPPQPAAKPLATSTPFAKPALPSSSMNARARARARQDHSSWLDSCDGFVPNSALLAPDSPPQASATRPSAQRSTSPVRTGHTSNGKDNRSTNSWDDFDTSSKRDQPSASDRLAKRKAEKERETKNKAVRKEVDDIPTFMF